MERYLTAVRSFSPACFATQHLPAFECRISSPTLSTCSPCVFALQEVLKALLDCVGNLLVANRSMDLFCLRRLVFCLVPPRPLLEAPLPGKSWQAPPQQAAVQDLIIKALADILLLVPTAPKPMLSELSQRMPFRFDNRAAPCMFFRAVYRLSQTAAGGCIRDGLQAAMIDCLLNIDVEIKWQDIADQQAGELFSVSPALGIPACMLGAMSSLGKAVHFDTAAVLFCLSPSLSINRSKRNLRYKSQLKCKHRLVRFAVCRDRHLPEHGIMVS